MSSNVVFLYPYFVKISRAAEMISSGLEVTKIIFVKFKDSNKTFEYLKIQIALLIRCSMDQKLNQIIPKYAWFYLILATIIDIVTGCIHLFMPDGGAGTIAGFTLVPEADAAIEIINLFALLGSAQLAFSIIFIYIMKKKQDMIPIAIFIVCFLNGMGVMMDYFYKAIPHFYPNKIRTVILFVLGILVLIALKYRSKSVNISTPVPISNSSLFQHQDCNEIF
jgi:hypothetical protein